MKLTRLLNFGVAIFGLFTLTSCASNPIIGGIDFDNESFLAVLGSILEEDKFFQKRERCFFINGHSKNDNIYHNKKYQDFEQKLIEAKLYNASLKCADFDRKKAVDYIYPIRIFVDSPDFVLGVFIETNIVTHRTFYSGMVEDKTYRRIRQQMINYCNFNSCSALDMDTIKIVYVSYAKCGSPGYTITGMKNRILDVSQEFWVGCGHIDPGPPAP